MYENPFPNPQLLGKYLTL